MNHTILIVDDEPHIRLLLEQTLEDFENEGHEIISVENGPEALKTAKTALPGIIFLDLMLPEMDGYEVCKTIKNDPLLKNIYVIILTARGQENDRQKGREAGADRYITKPFDPDEVIAIVKEQFAKN